MKNEKRDGYHKTEVGWIPMDWDCVPLSSACFSKGEYGAAAPSIPYSPSLPRYIRITDITEDGRLSDKDPRSIATEYSSGCILEKGDFLFARTGSVGKTYLHEIDGLCAFAGYLIRFVPDPQKLIGRFLSIYTHSKYYYGWISSTMHTGVQPNINAHEYSALFLPLPPLEEQKQITLIISKWDKAIEKTQKLIDTKQQLLLCLSQKLLSGCMRFPEFGTPGRRNGELPEGWRLMKIGQLVKRVRKPVNVKPEQLYMEIGIRSHGKGIFHKEEHFGKGLGTKSIFWVKPNTFVLNIVFAWEQAIAKTTYQEDGLVASHRFPMYQPLDDLLDLDYFYRFFLTPHGKSLLSLVSPGGAGRNKTLNQDAFLKLAIPVPPVIEQKIISSILFDLENEIGILNRYFNALNSQKQALIQKLLTGEIRVNVN